MLRKDVQPGVVYAYKRRSYDEPVPVVVVTTDSLYLDLRVLGRLNGERAFRRRPGVSQAKTGLGLATFFLPGQGNPPVYDLSTDGLDLDRFEEWVDVRSQRGALRARVVDPRAIVGTWADHVAAQQERAQAEAARQALKDELEGRRRETEAETLDALARLAGVRLSSSSHSVAYADRAAADGSGGTTYRLSQDLMDRVVQVLERAQALLAGRGEVTWHPADGELLSMPEPPLGTKLLWRGRKGDPDLGVWEHREDGWHLDAVEPEGGGGPLSWASVRQGDLVVVRWGQPS